VERTRPRFVEESLAVLGERPRPGGRRKLSGKQEAHLIAVACTPAPSGQTRWTLHPLADKVVEVGFAASSAREAVRQVLKKTRSSRGCAGRGVRRRRVGSSSRPWGPCPICMLSLRTPRARRSTSTTRVNS
jgi:Homeodomain-like domain